MSAPAIPTRDHPVQQAGTTAWNPRSRVDPGREASILTEALPWLETYAGKTVVIKYGGNAMIDDELKRAFASDIVFMKRCGVHPVIVHGGGPQITSMLTRLGIPSEFRGGFRVTTPEAMDVVRMVLVGQVGRDLVGLINARSSLAIGMSGEDGGCSPPSGEGWSWTAEEVDLGLVGDVVEVRTEAIAGLIAAGQVPVVASIAPDRDGVVHNVNADTAAAALAVALSAERLVVLTDVEGLYRDWPNSTDVITELSASELRELMPTLESGMVPKMEACLRAVEGGLTRATITDGRIPHALLLEIFTNAGIGTMVTRTVSSGSAAESFRAEGIPPHELANGGLGLLRSANRSSRRDRDDDSPGQVLAAPDPIITSRELSGPPDASFERGARGVRRSVMNTFGPPKRVFVRGEGCYVWDANGRRYLDLLAALR